MVTPEQLHDAFVDFALAMTYGIEPDQEDTYQHLLDLLDQEETEND